MEHQLRSKEEAYENVNTNIKKAKQNNVIRMPKNYEAFAVIGNFVYVVKQGQFVDMTNPKNMYNQKQFNEAFQHIKFSDDKTTPNSFIRKHQVEHRVVTDMVMKPSSNKRIVTGDYGQKYLNLYAPASEPEGAYENYKRPDIMLEHMLWLCNGHDKSRLHILKWIAHLIHKPETRMTHGLIISGSQGTGKSMLAEFVGDIVGDDNYSKVTPSQMKGSFQYWMLGKRFILVEEIYENGNWGVYNKIKPYFSDPLVNCNIKNKNEIEFENHVNFMMLSNQYNPLPISKGDRRIFYIHSKVTKRDAHYYGRLKNWMDNENGKWHFKKYLKDEIVPLLDEQNKDHRNFAFVEPLMTKDKSLAIKDSLHPLEAFISDQIAQDNEQREEIFKNDKWFLLNDFTANLPIELQHFSKSSNYTSRLKEFGVMRLPIRKRVKTKRLWIYYCEHSEAYVESLFATTKAMPYGNQSKEHREKIFNSQAGKDPYDEISPI
ncbi:MAG: primase-helicase family protein [Dehalococcoidia bacterium]|tara:strand:+ start:978 stop:2438 length:1461 start_codon:yes stop_codon:yes gene_type:complete